MASTRLPLHRRLATRLLVYGLVPTLIATATVRTINSVRSYRSAHQQATGEVVEAARLAAAEIGAQNQRVALLVQTLGQMQIDGKMFGERVETLNFLREVLESHAELQAVYVGYEPNADGNDRASLTTVPGTAMSPEGRFIPYLRRDPKAPDGVRLEQLVGMEDPQYLYYLEPKRVWEQERRKAVVFTKPYVYEGVALIEQTYPLVLDGRFVGIAGVDRSLAEIESVLRMAASRIDGDCFLSTVSADRVQRFIAATTDQGPSSANHLGTKEVSATPYLKLMSEPGNASGEVRVFEDTDPVLGEACYYGVLKLPTSGWTLVVRKSQSDLVAEFWRLFVLDTATAAAGIVFVALALLWFGRGVARRMGLAVESADRIADGNLSEPVPETRASDETGQLLDAFRTMSTNLNSIVGQVRQASIQINSTATELAATSLRQQETVAGFSASTTQVAAASREMAATGDELLKTMQQIADSAAGSAEKAEEGRSGLTTMRDAMHRLDRDAASVASRLGAINEKAQAINTIMGTITKVADQTNLLSVNAAIEAEKAGEFGVGFLVVAREIRRLADQTAAATLDIDRTVRQMQGAVSSGVMEMDRFGDSLRECVGAVEQVGDRLEGIIHHVEEDVERVQRATQSMEAQAAGVRQVDDAIRQLSAGARQSADATQEFGRAAQDLQSAIANLKSAVALVRLRS